MFFPIVFQKNKMQVNYTVDCLNKHESVSNEGCVNPIATVIIIALDLSIMSQNSNKLTSRQANPLFGSIVVPGDKSISHRALIIGSLAIGTTKIRGLLNGEDVMSTKNALVSLGVDIWKDDNEIWFVKGVGLNGMISPPSPLNLGNSGTGVRLIMGVVAGQKITATFFGDKSLSMRPMDRITNPLDKVGAKIISRDRGLLPVTIEGTRTPSAITYVSTVASAQIKSAILFSGLNARGTTKITEPLASRDHSESMLCHFGASITKQILPDNQCHIELTGEAELHATEVIVPRDPSSAAFPVVAALITPGSDICLPGIGMNPLRIGLLTTLREMGGEIAFKNERIEGGEPVADLHVRASELRGISVPQERVASMIDEFPILAIAAAKAHGTTKMSGIGELRVKETDRVKVMAKGLRACGVIVEYDDENMFVTGQQSSGGIKGGAIISAEHDHRIAMSFLILGTVTDNPVTVTGCDTIKTSFPCFQEIMNKLGTNIIIGDDL